MFLVSFFLGRVGLQSPLCADGVGKGDAREGLAPGRVRTKERSPCAIIPWDSVLDREVQSFWGQSTPELLLGSASRVQVLDKGQCCDAGARAGPPARDSHWDGTKTLLGWDFCDTGRKLGLWVGTASLGGKER